MAHSNISTDTLQTLTTTLKEAEVRAVVDGIDELAAAVETFLNNDILGDLESEHMVGEIIAETIDEDDYEEDDEDTLNHDREMIRKGIDAALEHIKGLVEEFIG